MFMSYKKVQVILGLIKRENLIVIAGPVSLPFIPRSSFKRKEQLQHKNYVIVTKYVLLCKDAKDV